MILSTGRGVELLENSRKDLFLLNLSDISSYCVQVNDIDQYKLLLSNVQKGPL